MVISKYHNPEDGIYLDRTLTDVVKLLSCMMVAIHHYANYAISTGYSGNIILRLFSTQGGYLGVALFFFLSGYGLMKSESKHHLGFKAFVVMRFGKVFLPVLLVTLLWLPIYLFVVTGGGANDNWAHLLWWMGDDVMWFVKTLALQYLFFYIYAAVRQSKPKHRLFFLVLITVIAFFISYFVQIRHAISLPLFYLGILIADFEKPCRKALSKVLLTICLMVAMVGICYWGRNNMMTFHAMFNYIAILPVLLFFANYKVSFERIPSWIGGSSFDVYLVHNKGLIFLRHSMGIVPLWLFVTVTIATTASFYGLRKLLRL